MTAETEAYKPLATTTPKLNKALSQLQGELPRIKKTKTAEVKDQQGRVLYKYDYADLGDVVADVGPLLAKCGLAFHCSPTINPADRREMILLWSLLHESGEEKAGEWPLGPVNQKPQSLGSAITYGRRYCFTAVTNIVLEDDDDGQRAQQDGSRQSAGDLWEQATPAPPRQARQRPAAPEASQDVVKPLLARADTVITKAAADVVAREADALRRKGLITRDQADHVQHRLDTRLASLREAAKPVEAEDLAKAAQDAAEGSQESGGTPAEPPGSDSHKALVSRAQGQFKRLGFTDEDRAERLWAAGKLAGVADLESLNGLDPDELGTVGRALARCRDRKALEELLAKAGGGSDG